MYAKEHISFIEELISEIVKVREKRLNIVAWKLAIANISSMAIYRANKMSFPDLNILERMLNHLQLGIITSEDFCSTIKKWTMPM